MSAQMIFKYLLCGLAAVVAYIEPTLPYLLCCTLAVIFDILSAWDLSRRVAIAHPDRAKGKKFTSSAANKVFGTLLRIYSVVFLAYLIDKELLPFCDMYLANIISAVFCVIQVVSILENISSCNGERWAKILQKVLIDKTKRHLEVDIDEDINNVKNKRKWQ